MIRTDPKILDDLAKKLVWGTYGINGDQPLQWKPLETLKTDHLEAILITQYHLGEQYREVVLHIIKARYLAMDVKIITTDHSIDSVGILQPQLS